ncbi:hypothetical protein IAU60_006939 [Kwoniella sp. DSM 27419]
MGTKTPRARILRHIELSLHKLLPLWDVPSIRRTILSLLRIHRATARNRYWDRWVDDGRVPAPSWRDNIPPLLQDGGISHFQAFRMSRARLLEISDLFSNDIVFNVSRTCPQPPPLYQIAALIYQLAHGTSYRQIAKVFGVQTGTISSWTWRALIAIVRLKDNYIYWPSAQERRNTAAYWLAHHGIPPCVGLIDGCHTHLYERPSLEDGSAFYCRHGKYGYNNMLVVDHTRQVRYLHTGYAGSASDTLITHHMEPLRHPARYFSRGEYLMGDKLFPCGSNIVALYKESSRRTEDSVQQLWFNRRCSRLRVKVEHVFGIMKARFTALRHLKVHIRDRRGQARAQAMITAAAVLHNLLVSNDDIPPPADESEDGSDHDPAVLEELEPKIGLVPIQESEEREGGARRAALLAWMLNFEAEQARWDVVSTPAGTISHRQSLKY